MALNFLRLRWNRRAAEASPRSRAAETVTDRPCITFRNRYNLLPPHAKSAERYIISADISPIFSGLGCMIRVLPPCWAYARETGRTLIIDWRGNPYTRQEPSHNLFDSLFEPLSAEQAGVPVISDGSVNEMRFPQPLLTTGEAMTMEDGTTVRMPNGGLDHDSLAGIIANCTPVDCPTILPSLPSVFRITRQWIVPRRIRLTDDALAHCYALLRPRPAWREEARAFHDERMRGVKVIGLHVRHGNGEGDFRSHFRHREIADFESFMNEVIRVVERYGARRFGGRFTVFLATDSDLVIRRMKERFPDLLTRPVRRPAEGAGVDFDHAYREGTQSGIRSAADALIDMLLLAKCDAVMITRFTSFAYHIRYTLERPGAEFYDDQQFAELASRMDAAP